LKPCRWTCSGPWRLQHSNRPGKPRLDLAHLITLHTRLYTKVSCGRCYESRQGLPIFLLTTASRPGPGPVQPPIQRVPRALSLGVKRQGH